MVRQKAVGATTLKSWGDADNALKKIGALTREIAKKEVAATEKIAVATAKLQQDTAEQIAKKTALLHDVEAFALNNKKDLTEETGKKSIELNHGTLGFRKSTKIALLGKTDAALALITAAGAAFKKKYITVKESPNKKAMSDLSDDRLVEIGMQRKITDDFWCEPNETTAKAGPGA